MRQLLFLIILGSMCTVQITILYTNILTVIRFALYLFMSEMTLKKYANDLLFMIISVYVECNFFAMGCKGN